MIRPRGEAFTDDDLRRWAEELRQHWTVPLPGGTREIAARCLEYFIEVRGEVEQRDRRIAAALVHLERIGPPSHTCVGDPVCGEQAEWPPEQWCDSCLANAARYELATLASAERGYADVAAGRVVPLGDVLDQSGNSPRKQTTCDVERAMCSCCGSYCEPRHLGDEWGMCDRCRHSGCQGAPWNGEGAIERRSGCPLSPPQTPTAPTPDPEPAPDVVGVSLKVRHRTGPGAVKDKIAEAEIAAVWVEELL